MLDKIKGAKITPAMIKALAATETSDLMNNSFVGLFDVPEITNYNKALPKQNLKYYLGITNMSHHKDNPNEKNSIESSFDWIENTMKLNLTFHNKSEPRIWPEDNFLITAGYIGFNMEGIEKGFLKNPPKDGDAQLIALASLLSGRGGTLQALIACQKSYKPNASVSEATYVYNWQNWVEHLTTSSNIRGQSRVNIKNIAWRMGQNNGAVNNLNKCQKK